jgi:hypothetical protein
MPEMNRNLSLAYEKIITMINMASGKRKGLTRNRSSQARTLWEPHPKAVKPGRGRQNVAGGKN